jgi:hypothetical protein
MAASGMKRGEKILFGIFGLMGLFAIASFIMLEIVRARTDKALYPTSTHYDLSAEGLKGSTLIRTEGCTACHRAMRNGTNMGLDLDGIGSRRSVQFLTDFLKDPEATYPARTVDHGEPPKRAAYVSKLPEEDRHALVIFLSELRADQGSSAARLPADARSGFIDEMVKIWAPDNWKSEYKDIRDEAELKEKQKEEHDAGSK